MSAAFSARFLRGVGDLLARVFFETGPRTGLFLVGAVVLFFGERMLATRTGVRSSWRCSCGCGSWSARTTS